MAGLVPAIHAEQHQLVRDESATLPID